MNELQLSDTTITLLALIEKRPLNSYRINKVLGGNGKDHPFSIKESTCYASIRALEREGLIEASLQKNSNMPAKKVYSITSPGRKSLENYLVQTLTDLEEAHSSFEKAIHFICSIPRGEAVTAIQKHRTLLETDIESLRSRYEHDRMMRNIPFTTRILTRQLLKKRQVELDTLNELKKEIEWNERWDYFPVEMILGEQRGSGNVNE